jgi:hypothetical protein
MARDLLAIRLGQYGADVITASSAEAVMEAMAQERPRPELQRRPTAGPKIARRQWPRASRRTSPSLLMCQNWRTRLQVLLGGSTIINRFVIVPKRLNIHMSTLLPFAALGGLHPTRPIRST